MKSDTPSQEQRSRVIMSNHRTTTYWFFPPFYYILSIDDTAFVLTDSIELICRSYCRWFVLLVGPLLHAVSSTTSYRTEDHFFEIYSRIWRFWVQSKPSYIWYCEYIFLAFSSVHLPSLCAKQVELDLLCKPSLWIWFEYNLLHWLLHSFPNSAQTVSVIY